MCALRADLAKITNEKDGSRQKRDKASKQQRTGAGSRARLRNRNKARYELRQQGLKHTAPRQDDDDDFDTMSTTTNSCSTLLPLHLLYETEIKDALRKIESGAVSYFSSKRLWENRAWINITSIPLAWVSPYKIYTLGNARLGQDHVQRVLSLIEKQKQSSPSASTKTTSLYEYAIWLGEYRLINSLIAAGCLDLENVVGDKDESVAAPRLLQVLRRNVPLTLSSHIVKRIVEMRLLGSDKMRNEMTRIDTPPSQSTNNDHYQTEPEEDDIGGAAENDLKEQDVAVGSQLCFGPPCFHSFDESAMWEYVSDNMLNDVAAMDSSRIRTNDLLLDANDTCEEEDIVTCPVCAWTPNNLSLVCNTRIREDHSVIALDYVREACSDVTDPSSVRRTLSPTALERIQERQTESLRKFHELPADARQLKRSKTSKPKRMTLTTNWQQAVAIGRTQEVRMDRWFAAAEGDRGFLLSFHTLLGCLRRGVNVNAINEYGQTAMHVVLWRWKNKDSRLVVRVIQLLFLNGADPNISSNGGVTCWHLLSLYDSEKAVCLEQLMHQYYPQAASITCWSFVGPPVGEHDRQRLSAPLWQSLIEPTSCHPGAGSFMLDDAISQCATNSLLELHQELPVAADAKKMKELCSDRSYYSDSHGYIRKLLEPVLQQLSLTRSQGLHLDGTTKSSAVIVSPLFRFLHYRLSGTELAAHEDLCRVFYAATTTDDAADDEQQKQELRSTHTLILYLTDCTRGGGETLLLQSLQEQDEILARVEPKRGRLFVFPHICPHAGAPTVGDSAKILLRGEVYIPGYESEY